MDTLRPDSIEREPLHHFHPGTHVLRAREPVADSPALVAEAVREGARSVAVPPGFSRMHDLARVAGLRGIRIVSSSDASDLAQHFATLRWVDALVVRMADRVAPFEQIARLVGEGVWVEIVCTVESDAAGDERTDAFSRALVLALGPGLPLHVVPLHDDAAGREHARHARWIAQANGLHFVYGGDPSDPRALCSWCPGCDGLIADRHDPRGPFLDEICPACGWTIAGRFLRQPRRRSSHTMARVDGPAPLRTAAGDRK